MRKVAIMACSLAAILVAWAWLTEYEGKRPARFDPDPSMELSVSGGRLLLIFHVRWAGQTGETRDYLGGLITFTQMGATYIPHPGWIQVWSVPLWFVSVLLGVYPVLVAMRAAWRRRVRIRRRLCSQCGYDLRGLQTPRCPECGTGFDGDLLEEFNRT